MTITQQEKSDKPIGYCVHCKAKREIKNGETFRMKNGKPAIKGVCSTCDTKMIRIGVGK